MDKKRELKKLDNELDNSAITLTKFLVNYYGLLGDSLDVSKMTHKEVKKIFPELKRLGKEDLKHHKEDLYIGEVVAVRDYSGEVLPYICPEIDNTFTITVADERKGKYIIQSSIKQFIEDENLRICDVYMLCNKYKLEKRFKEYRATKRVLKGMIQDKNKQVKDYKIKKKELKYKEDMKEYEKKYKGR